MKFRVLWDVAPSSHVEVNRSFREASASIINAMGMARMMEAICTSEMYVNFNVTTRCYIPEDTKLQFPFLITSMYAYLWTQILVYLLLIQNTYNFTKMAH
jgi:hypothetical protein